MRRTDFALLLIQALLKARTTPLVLTNIQLNALIHCETDTVLESVELTCQRTCLNVYTAVFQPDTRVNSDHKAIWQAFCILCQSPGHYAAC